MRFPLLLILMVLAAGFLADWYVLRLFRAAPGAKPSRLRAVCRSAFIIVSALASATLIVVACAPKKSGSDGQLVSIMWGIFAYASVYVPTFIFVLISVVRQGLGRLLRRRLRGIAIGGGAVALALFAAMWWGALVTRYSIDVRRVEVPVAGLPASFRGFTIAQISDIHTGTYGDNPRFLAKLVERVNSLHPDIILFTGDIVNRHSDELVPFMASLSELDAPCGVWSVMGNHDYGEYYRWPSEEARLADVARLKQMQGQMGWHMLNNQNAAIRRGSDSIMLIGVENIGDPPFTTYGNLKQAYATLDDTNVKILMTHNPAHWTDSISDNPSANVALTLSGHTHAMQMRVLGWSPASLRYPAWGGLYADTLGRHLYVNIGIGEVGFPSRIGAAPEVTLITLTPQ